MDSDVDAGKVEDSGENGLQGHLGIGPVHILGHEESGGAHNGGHDLSAGGSGGLHSAGKLRLVAGLLHHGDGHRTGGHSVAHRGAGHHTAQGGGDDGHLGGTARGGTGHAVGQVDEEVGDAGALQERAEDDEDDDVLLADVDGGTHNAVGGIEEVINHLAEADGGQGVDQQRAQHTQNGNAHTPAAQLHKGQHTDNGQHHHFGVVGHKAGELNHLVCLIGKVEEGKGSRNHNDNIVPGEVIGPYMSLPDGVVQIAHNQNQAQENVQLLFLQRGPAFQRGKNTVAGEENA